MRAVLTAADLDLEPLTPMLNRPEFVPVEFPMLAAEQVRHAGEPVALVIADSPHAAEDATELIVVDYEPVDAVASIEAALDDDAQRVHERLESNVLLDVPFADDPELDDVLAGAELVVEAEFTSGRLTAVPLEGRACLAEWERGGQRVVLHTSTQIPHVVRTTVAGVLGVDEHRVRVVAPDVGGGFGLKCVVAREEVLVCRRGARGRRAREVGRGPRREPARRLPGPRAALHRRRGLRRRRPHARPSTPTSWPTSAPTRRTRSPAASSR